MLKNILLGGLNSEKIKMEIWIQGRKKKFAKI